MITEVEGNIWSRGRKGERGGGADFSADIIQIISCGKMRWTEHVAWTGQMSNM